MSRLGYPLEEKGYVGSTAVGMGLQGKGNFSALVATRLYWQVRLVYGCSREIDWMRNMSFSRPMERSQERHTRLRNL